LEDHFKYSDIHKYRIFIAAVCSIPLILLNPQEQIPVFTE